MLTGKEPAGTMVYRATIVNQELILGEARIISQNNTWTNIEHKSVEDRPAFGGLTRLTRANTAHTVHTTPAGALKGFINGSMAEIDELNERVKIISAAIALANEALK
jgi:hypothetical protein